MAIGFLKFDLFIEACNVSIRRQDIQRTLYTCIPFARLYCLFHSHFDAYVIFTFLVYVRLVCSGFGTFEVGVSLGRHNF